MKLATFLFLLLTSTSIAVGQKTLPALKDGTVVDEKTDFRQDGPLHIEGHVKLKGIFLDLRGPITVASGADLTLEDVKIKVSDPPGAANGTSGLQCEGPAKITVLRSTMAAEGTAHPMWGLQGEVTVDDFQTKNTEFHLNHVDANLNNFTIFELEISRSSKVVGRHLRLVFLSTHTGDDDKIEFSNIPADQPFSQKLRMGSQATADLSNTTVQLFLLYVHGSSDVSLSHIGRAQLAIFPDCKGTLTLPHGIIGSAKTHILVPELSASNCPFHIYLNDVNADTWDVYARGNADVTFTGSVIDELTADGKAKITVRDSEVYADWLSFGADSTLRVENSTVGALRLAAQRPDLATSQIRLNGRSQATFDHVKFDCGIVAADDSTLAIHNSLTPPNYIRRGEHAVVRADPELKIEMLTTDTPRKN